MSPEEQHALTLSVAAELAAGLVDEDAKYLVGLRRTHRHQNDHLPVDLHEKKAVKLGSGKRAYRKGGLSRFESVPVSEPVPRERVALDRRHPALHEARTIFESSVFSATERKHVLIPGINNPKIGGRVTKGPWAGFPMFHLSLEERRTCPRSCAQWDTCYGNFLPVAVRIRYDDTLIAALDQELRALQEKHPAGFVVRLHILGDFPDAEYVKYWLRWSRDLPALKIWGYTAHARESEIGRLIWLANGTRVNPWAVRFSVPPEAPRQQQQATVYWDTPASLATVDGTVVCPQELGHAATCGSCGLCWSPEAQHLRIAFLGHGRQMTRRPKAVPETRDTIPRTEL